AEAGSRQPARRVLRGARHGFLTGLELNAFLLHPRDEVSALLAERAKIDVVHEHRSFGRARVARVWGERFAAAPTRLRDRSALRDAPGELRNRGYPSPALIDLVSNRVPLRHRITRGRANQYRGR